MANSFNQIKRNRARAKLHVELADLNLEFKNGETHFTYIKFGHLMEVVRLKILDLIY